MTSDYTTPGRLMIAMYDYINGVIKNTGEVYKKEQAQLPQPLNTSLKFSSQKWRTINYYPNKRRKSITPLRYNICTYQRGADQTFSNQ